MKHKLQYLAIGAICMMLPVNAGAAQYVVESGDTLGGIGSMYGIAWEEIAEANNIEDVRKLMPGTILNIGGLSQDGASYQMVYGDTLGAIGRELGIEWQQIAEFNGITDPTRIIAGTVLSLPGLAVVQEPAPAAEEPMQVETQEQGAPEAEAGVTEITVNITNNGYEIPAIVTLPQGEGPFPGVVMLHGTGSDKNEAGGGYDMAAPLMAEAGIATIRIDFIGNGESQEDYINYNFTSAVSDANAAAAYLSGLTQVDAEKMGIMGWSQGGTVALLAAGTNDTYKSVVTWAGASGLSGMFTEERYAIAQEQGYYTLEFDWREPLHLGLQWFTDVLEADVLNTFSASSAPVLAINGLQDESVAPENAALIVEASSNPISRTYFIDNCDHTFNVFSGDMGAINETIQATWEFFNETLAAGEAATASEENQEAFTEAIVRIPNDGRHIPATILTPAGEGPFPAVVINHGHGGSREEGGGFTSLAENLARAGILSIRMDFPGCGDSTESFTKNTMTNMISDSNASLQYILENCDVDKDNLGILGYSMGGRIALTIASDENSPYKSMALLAPSANEGGIAAVNMFGGEEGYNSYLEEAQGEQGYALYTTVYGQEQHLSPEWFEDMNNSSPLKDIDAFQGNILLIYGDQDTVVTEEINELVPQARPDTEKIVVPDADHGYGFYSDQPDVTQAVEGGIISFFTTNLK